MRRIAPVVGLLFAGLSLLVCGMSSAEEAERPRFENHWVVIMELGDKAASIDSKTETKLKRGHLRYMSKLEKEGQVHISSGFRVHEDERHRELAFYRSDLTREEVEAMAKASPIVEGGLWKPFVYIWPTAWGDVQFGQSSGDHSDG